MNHKFVNAKRFFSQSNKPVYLYQNIWKKGTTALLHSPRVIDKTPLAMAIADSIACKGTEVLFVDTVGRLDDLKAESDRLYIFTPEFESIDDKSDYADLVFEAIEQAVRTTSIRTFVVNSVNRIAALSFGRNASPAYIMKRLVALQVKCKLSILVVADQSTKTVNNALVSLSDVDLALDVNPVGKDSNKETEKPVGWYSTGYDISRIAKDICDGVNGDTRVFPVCRPAK